MSPPVVVTWDGATLTPRAARVAEAAFKVGETLAVVRYEGRSDKTHKHEFAWLRDAWLSLPEEYAEIYPSPEHLRKRALIEAGYYHEQAIDADSHAAAERVAAYIRGRDKFSLIIVRGALVMVRTAMSQSFNKMKRDEFRKSKTAIIEIISAMIGVTPAELVANAGQAA